MVAPHRAQLTLWNHNSPNPSTNPVATPNQTAIERKLRSDGFESLESNDAMLADRRKEVSISENPAPKGRPP